MKKTKSNKLIIVLAAVILVAAVILAVGLMKQNGGLDIFGSTSPNKETLGTSKYVIQTPVNTSEVKNTDSWVNFDKFASDLATATDTSSTSTSDTTLTTGTPLTSLVYVYVETSVIAPSQQPTTEPPTTEPEVVDYKYTIDPSTKTVTLNEYIGKDYDKTLYIPVTVMGNKVTEIGDKCFADKPITTVCIKDNILKIGDNAFRNCKELKSVVFLNSYDLESVGQSAFRGCTKLTTVNLPCTKRIEIYAFGDCLALEKFEIKTGTKFVGGFCFNGCDNMKELVVPPSVTSFDFTALPTFEDEFESNKVNFVVKCMEGSDADFVAKSKGIRTEYIYQF